MRHLSGLRPLLGATLTSLVLAGSLLTAPTGSAAPAAPTSSRTYRNPLEPAIPGDGTVDSCADPIVLKGQRPGDPFWYLYCTTDPLNDEDLDGDGNLRFHPIPTMRSRDLVHWTYLGDALPEPPDWAGQSWFHYHDHRLLGRPVQQLQRLAGHLGVILHRSGRHRYQPNGGPIRDSGRHFPHANADAGRYPDFGVGQ